MHVVSLSYLLDRLILFHSKAHSERLLGRVLCSRCSHLLGARPQGNCAPSPCLLLRMNNRDPMWDYSMRAGWIPKCKQQCPQHSVSSDDSRPGTGGHPGSLPGSGSQSSLASYLERFPMSLLRIFPAHSRSVLSITHPPTHTHPVRFLVPPAPPKLCWLFPLQSSPHS